MATQCPKCDLDNPSDSKFCKECGTQLTPSEFSSDVTKTIETPAQELSRGTIFAKRYEILEKLGKGGMGEVYRVKDKKLDEEMALKVVKPEIAAHNGIIERFKNELKLARKIAHRNVCKMYDLNEEEETPFITMEYVQGEDLKRLIRKKERLVEKEAIALAKQVCEGLSEAHRLGVVHRDLKPSNIMIDEEGNAKVMDFGIARSVEAAGVTQTGVMIGTPDYISPEQAEGEKIDQRSDIYSLGVILYEMMTGSVPFKGDTALGVALKHKTQFPKAPKKVNPKISEDMSHLILVCMEKEREKRYQSVEELLSDLTKIEKGLPTTKREVSAKTLEERAWKNSIAVLPFTNMSADPEQEYFCDGISEELINALTKIKKLHVVARTSAFTFKGKDVGIEEIGKKLNVDKVLEGSVRKVGNRLRITAQLINVEDGYHIWSERFDLEMDDIFAIQDEISLAIVDKLEVDILGEEKAKLVKRYTKNTEAYNLYLKGCYQSYKLTIDGFEKGIKYFNAAIENDPTYALAYSGLAGLYIVWSYWGNLPPNDAYPKARKAAEKALDIDETIAEAHEAMGLVYDGYDWNWEASEREFKRALELEPNSATAHTSYAWYLLITRREEEAIQEIELAQELDPLSSVINGWVGYILHHTHRYDDVIEKSKEWIEMDPYFYQFRVVLGMVYQAKSKMEEAIAEFEKAQELYPGEVLSLVYLEIAYYLTGRLNDAEEILDSLRVREKTEYIAPSLLGFIYLTRGQLEESYEWLEKAYEEHDNWLPLCNVPAIRDQLPPRWTDILKKIGLD